MHVASNRLAVDARFTRDAVKTLPRRLAAQHLFDVDHRQLAVGHGHLPTATRAVVGTNPGSLPGRLTRDPPGGPEPLVTSPCKSAGPMSLRTFPHPSPAGGPFCLQKGWSHDPAKNSGRLVPCGCEPAAKNHDVPALRAAKMFPIMTRHCGSPARARCFNGVGTY
jgi:hypothetical protein